jgi:hypothetical protein
MMQSVTYVGSIAKQPTAGYQINPRHVPVRTGIRGRLQIRKINLSMRAPIVAKRTSSIVLRIMTGRCGGSFRRARGGINTLFRAGSRNRSRTQSKFRGFCSTAGVGSD